MNNKEKIDGIIGSIGDAVTGPDETKGLINSAFIKFYNLMQSQKTKEKKTIKKPRKIVPISLSLDEKRLKKIIGLGIIVLVVIGILSFITNLAVSVFEPKFGDLGTFALLSGFVGSVIIITALFIATSFKSETEKDEVTPLLKKSKDAYEKR